MFLSELYYYSKNIHYYQDTNKYFSLMTILIAYLHVLNNKDQTAIFQ